MTAFTNPVLRQLDEPAQLKAAHLLTARLKIMPAWNVLGLVLLIVEAVVHRNEPRFSLFVAACVLWVAAAAITFTLMLSLNNRLARAESLSSPQQSLLDYERWSARHLPRLLGAGGGAALPLARNLCLSNGLFLAPEKLEVRSAANSTQQRGLSPIIRRKTCQPKPNAP